ncbi:hypothetical protein QVD17_19742 [Tagetes erecta]|uniref:RNA-directed DNA polymerase, eukaryota, reverse transcriptase zinc-binding domain protein n=1 Tax=Tagetes erecta TaxID=13708 RepID=A0AAD8NWR1_TARER|nr:hypothetical protein QVD17_19742 [Tagetes erecta]
MNINHNLNDQTSNGNAYATNVNAHVANVQIDTANVSAHTTKVKAHMSNVELHTAGHYANTPRVNTHTATVNAYTAKGDNLNDTTMLHNGKDELNLGDTTKVDMQNVHMTKHNRQPTSVNKQKIDTARVMVENDHMDKHVGNFESSKVETTSDDTTNVIHESNTEAILDEERFLKQKSKVHWLAEGDANIKYFHNTLKCRNHRAPFVVITDSNGILHEGKAVPKTFVDHYVGFQGKEDVSIIPITQELFDVRIDKAMSVDMIREVTVDEIKRTIFAFGDDKAPGPDGFTAAFCKKAWDIVDSCG